MQIPNELAGALYKIRIPGEARQVFDAIFAKTVGPGKDMDWIAVKQLSNMTGQSTANVSRALRKLRAMNLTVEKDSTAGVTRGINMRYNTWKPLSKKTRGIKKGKSPPPKKRIATAAFERSFKVFWPVYPRKVGKRNALKAWLKIKPDEVLVKKIVDAVKAHAKSDQWTRDDGQYVPHPATWLNGELWNDELGENISEELDF